MILVIREKFASEGEGISNVKVLLYPKREISILRGILSLFSVKIGEYSKKELKCVKCTLKKEIEGSLAPPSYLNSYQEKHHNTISPSFNERRSLPICIQQSFTSLKYHSSYSVLPKKKPACVGRFASA